MTKLTYLLFYLFSTLWEKGEKKTTALCAMFELLCPVTQISLIFLDCAIQFAFLARLGQSLIKSMTLGKVE